MTILRAFEALAVLSTLLVVLLGAFRYLEDNHASYSALYYEITGVQIAVLEEDLDDDNTRLYFYEEDAIEAPLSAREQLRKEQLEKAAEAKTRKLERLQAIQEKAGKALSTP